MVGTVHTVMGRSWNPLSCICWRDGCDRTSHMYVRICKGCWGRSLHCCSGGKCCSHFAYLCIILCILCDPVASATILFQENITYTIYVVLSVYGGLIGVPGQRPGTEFSNSVDRQSRAASRTGLFSQLKFEIVKSSCSIVISCFIS